MDMSPVDMLVHDVNILAQDDNGGWGGLVYLLIFMVLPALKSFGVWLRKRFGEQTDEPEQTTDPSRETPKRLKRAVRRETVAGTPKEERIPQAVPVKESPPPLARPAASVRPRPAAPKRPVRRRRPEPPQQAPSTADVRRQRLSTIADIMEKSTRPERQASPTAQPPGKRPLLPRKLDRATLRSAIILSEILQPPLALRQDETDRSL